MNYGKLLLLGATALAGVASFGGSANAIAFTSGSLAIQATTTTTTQLSTTTQFAIVPPSVALNTGTGDFSAVSATAIPFAATIDLGNGSTFSFSNAGIGTFVASSAPVTILENIGGSFAVL
ncbi:MAG: hypothetical protein JO255_20580, partial [Alphaproteobacteria bacterium]|nr:hypothetical protein [Alphaproteobacteria bacterium]